jgi:hypothetical protein
LDSVEKTFECREDSNGYTRLFWKGTEDEVVLDVQGYLASHQLPPIPKGYRHVLLPLAQTKTDNETQFCV